MSRILVVEEDLKIVKTLRENLEKEFCAEIHHFSLAADAIRCLQSLRFDLIITRNTFDSMNDISSISSEIFNYSYDLGPRIPMIVMGDADHIGEFVFYLSSRFRIEELNRLVIKVLNFSDDELKYFRLPEYVPILISSLHIITNSACDIYIKIPKSSGDRYLKRFHANDEMDKETLDKYTSKSIKDLYIKKEDHRNLMRDLLEKSISKMSDINSSDHDFVQTSSESFDLTHNLIKSMGITQDSVKIADAALTNMKEKIADSDYALNDYLKDLLANPASLSFKRSYFIILLSHYIIPLMDWGKEEQQKLVFDQISFVAYFHDFYLDSEVLQKIMSKKELDKANLSTEDFTLVNGHANLASTLIQSYPHAPNGADIIIRQHHGMSNGVGFCERYTSSISPMAIMFIVLEAVTDKIIQSSNTTDLNDTSYRRYFSDAVKSVEGDFQLPSFRRILALLKVVQKI